MAADEGELGAVNLKSDHHSALIGEYVADSHRQRLLTDVRNRVPEALSY